MSAFDPQPKRRTSNVFTIDPAARAGGGGIGAAEVLPDDGDDDHPDVSAGSVTIDDDGLITIDFGAPKKERRATKFDSNLALDLDESALSQLASRLIESIEADIASRREWQDTADMAPRYLGTKLDEPGAAGADGTVSKQVSTALLESVVKLWSTARAELLPVGGPVKVKRDDMPVPQGAAPGLGHNGGPAMEDAATPQDAGNQDLLADALEADMNWYLTKGDPEYYPDYSRMLMSRALIGNAFRKVYLCPIARKPVSRWVKAQNLVVSNDCTHLSGATRVTEIIRITQGRMRRMQAQEAYLDIDLVQPTGEVTPTERAEGEIEGIDASPQLPEDYEHLVYECTTDLDSYTQAGLEILDKDETEKDPGYPLPYRVSIDLDSRAVLEIRRAWEEGDAEHKREKRYVKYGFVPSTGFYDWGMIHMAGNATQTATMIGRSVTDSALYSNFPGGMFLKSPGSREDSTVIRPLPGQFIGMNGGGATKITDLLMPMPYKPPSAEAMAIGQHAEQNVKDLAGVVDLPVGEGRIGNTPVGTIMSYVEAVSQVPGAVHKDDHVAQAEEFEMLRKLLAKTPALLTRGNKTPARQWTVVEELLAPDLTTAADPNTPSAVHRLMKLQGLLTAAAMPGFQGIPDWRALWALVVRLMGNGDPTQYTAPPQATPPPPPDPRVVAAQIKAQSQQASDGAKLQQAQVQHEGHMAELAADSQNKEADRQSAETRAAMSLEQAQIKAAADAAKAGADRTHDAGIAAGQAAHAADQASLDRTHEAGIAAAGLIQKHAQHLNENGLAAAGQQMQADQAAPDGSGT